MHYHGPYRSDELIQVIRRKSDAVATGFDIINDAPNGGSDDRYAGNDGFLDRVRAGIGASGEEHNGGSGKLFRDLRRPEVLADDETFPQPGAGLGFPRWSEITP